MTHPSPHSGLLALLLAAACTTPRRALLILLLYSVVSLRVRLFRRTLTALKLPAPPAVLGVYALGFGGALCFVLRLLFPDTAWLSLASPLPAVIFPLLGSVAAEETALRRYYPALLLVGVARELLAVGSLWGIALVPGVSRSFESGAGGLLVAALILWGFGISQPVLRQGTPYTALSALLYLALGSVGGVLTVALPPLYAVWLLTGIAAFGTVLLRQEGAWLCLTPLSVLWARSAAPLLCGVPIVLGAAVLAVLPALQRRMRLAAPPARFAGAPLALAVSAIVAALRTAV